MAPASQHEDAPLSEEGRALSVPPVRPRAAASLVVVREGPDGPEVLMGRRGRTARFMPGRFVFPGGAVQRSDYRSWPGEPSLRTRSAESALARAAIRETFEETGVLLGVPAASGLGGARAGCAVGEALVARGLAPALHALRLFARAITPSFSPVRFHARFFLVDAAHAAGTPSGGAELEEVAFYAVAHRLPSPISDVTDFMLRRALAVHAGESPAVPAPLYAYVGGSPRLRWPRGLT